MKVLHKRHDKSDEANAPDKETTLALIKKWSAILDKMGDDDYKPNDATVDHIEPFEKKLKK